MQIKKFLLVFGFILFSITIIICCNTQENKVEYNNQLNTKLNPDAPQETELLGKLEGTWEAEQTILKPEGTWSNEKKHAIWKWYYILEGHATQDDWITIDSLNEERVVGTNIRIYNAEEKQWHMAWIDKTNRRLATFTAVNENGIVIMDGINAKGRHIKNTFFNMTDNEFDWKQEWTFDDEKTWVEVAKIHCVRIKN